MKPVATILDFPSSNAIIKCMYTSCGPIKPLDLLLVALSIGISLIIDHLIYIRSHNKRQFFASDNVIALNCSLTHLHKKPSISLFSHQNSVLFTVYYLIPIRNNAKIFILNLVDYRL